MRELTDRGFFLLYGIGGAVLMDMGTAYITGIFLALALSSLCLILKKRVIKGMLLMAGCLGICIWPETAAFLPLLFYELLDARLYWALPAAAAALVRGGAAGAPFLIFLLLGTGGAALLWERGRRLREREEELRHVQDDGTERALVLKKRNQELLQKQDYETYAATLRERNRIAREIHDSVGHLLSRAILMTGALRAVNGEAAMEAPLESLESSLKEAMDSVRRSVHDLHDDSVDLQEAAGRLVRDFTFCRAELEYDMGPAVPGNIKYCLLAVQKEALANVIKHSDATEVRITMREHPAFYQMEIRDNGTLRASEEKPDGIGLIGMEERVRVLGGILKISREGGFRIFISIPKENV